MYADVTTLFSTLEVNVDTLINNELAKISEWLKINKLSLNVGKSKCILYKMINKALTIPVLKIDTTVIDNVKFFNVFGIIIDDNLNRKKTYRKYCQQMF